MNYIPLIAHFIGLAFLLIWLIWQSGFYTCPAKHIKELMTIPAPLGIVIPADINPVPVPAFASHVPHVLPTSSV